MRCFSWLVLLSLVSAGCGAGDSNPESTRGSAEDATPTFCDDAGDLVIVEEQVGDGEEAAPENIVLLNYEGRFENGEVFDRGDRVSYPLNAFIPGFRDGVSGMRVGGRRQLTIPPTMGYGPDGIRDEQTGATVIPSCATLVFDVELLDIVQ